MAKEPQDEMYLRVKRFIISCNEADINKPKEKKLTHVDNKVLFIDTILDKLDIVDRKDIIKTALKIDRKRRLVLQHNVSLDVDPQARNKRVAEARSEAGYIEKGIKAQEEAQNVQNGKLEGNTIALVSRLTHAERMELIRRQVKDKLRV